MSKFTSCDGCKFRGRAMCKGCRYHYQDLFEPKSKQKIIKLEEMVGSDVDMEFGFGTAYAEEIGHLNCIGGQTIGPKYYGDKHLERWSNCRIRENHWHHWKGDECPLPDGLIVDIQYRMGEVLRHEDYRGLVWTHRMSNFKYEDIIAFKVLGPTDDARYEWQKEKEE